MTEQLGPGRLYVISAPSGGGKTSLARALLQRLNRERQTARFSVSYTTRQRRSGERPGVDYHFVSNEVFEAMIGRQEFLEYAKVFDHYYGTSARETQRWLESGQDVLLDIDWQGAQQVKAHAADAVTIFICPPSRAELERRLRARGSEKPGAIERRLAEADDELRHAAAYDHQIINDSFDEALSALIGIFTRA